MGKKNRSLGCFFWIAFILLVALLFFINKNNISRVLEKTNAASIFQKKGAEEEKPNEVDLSGIQQEIEKIRAEETETEKKIEKETSESKTNKSSAQNQNLAKTGLEKDEKNNKNEQKKESSKKEINGEEQIKQTPETKKEEKKSDKKPKKKAEKRKAKIYLVKIESDGKLVRKALMRELVKTDSPLSDAIQSLLQGPTTAEAKQGYRSFIPPDTKLLSIEVKNSVAEINLSEEFQFNRYGIEAYQAQLAQIVFTACEFSTVSSVQFLIQNNKKEYLGAEGIWIGSPLSVNSF